MDLIHVHGHKINVDNEGFLCLTDMAKAGKPESRPTDIIRNWLQTQTTMEYLTAWETVNNPVFKGVENHTFKEMSNMSIPEWIENTGAVGLYSRLGKHGGTYAHEDIAMDFGAHISAMFRMYVFKEYKRLREFEKNATNTGWLLRREICKYNYTIQSDAVKSYKIPLRFIPPSLYNRAYSEEADILNIALFGFTASEWRTHNPWLALKGENARDYASENELIILGILEGMNAAMIKDNLPTSHKLSVLKSVVSEQLPILNKKDPDKALKKATDGSFQALYQQDGFPVGMFPQMPFMEYVEQKRLGAGTTKQ